ncbi:MAG: DUF1570 domain-containing protein [Planctomycetota bacterium]
MIRRRPLPSLVWFVSALFVGGSFTLGIGQAGAQTHHASATTPDTRPQPTRHIFASHHYHIHTDLTRAETVPFGRHMDAVYEAYVRRFAAFTPKRPEPMPLYLFRTEAEYHGFLLDMGIEARHSGGMFFVNHRRRGLATFIEGQSLSEVYAVLQHEGFHQFAWKYLGADLPTWVNEGLAQYFEDAPLVNGRLVVGNTDRARLARVRAALRSGETLPLGTLFALSEEAWADAVHHDESHSGLLYAQSWSAVYFLIHGEDGRYRSAFQQFLHRVNEGVPGDRAFADAFGRNPQSLQRRWASYVEGMEAPALSAAADGLEFLAIAMTYYDQQGWPVPDDLDTFETQLRKMGFAIRRVEQGVETIVSAKDVDVFRFSINRLNADDRPFELLAPSRNDLPPRVVARGLVPEPSIEWSRQTDGSLKHAVVYR